MLTYGQWCTGYFFEVTELQLLLPSEKSNLVTVSATNIKE